MGTSAEFWRAKAWPRDTSEMIFLRRAVGQLGRALFGGHWLGDEFAAQRLAPVNYSDVRGANNFIALHLPQFGRREYRGSMAPPPTSSIGRPHVDHDDHRPTFKEIAAGEQAAVREFIERHNAAALAAKERAARLMNRIADLASEGKLQTAYRGVAGGAFTPIPKDWWTTENLDPRFAFCTINPDDPFNCKSGNGLIYVFRADLEAVIGRPSLEDGGSEITRRHSGVIEAEAVVVPLEGTGPTSRSLSASLHNAFPGGVPLDMPLPAIREKIGDNSVFKIRGLKLKKLIEGGYDTTLKRILGRTPR
jgi:hypothetical protein